MIKRWKEHSYLLCLSISAVIIGYLCYTGWLPENLRKSSEESDYFEENLTFREGENQEHILENLKALGNNFVIEISETIFKVSENILKVSENFLNRQMQVVQEKERTDEKITEAEKETVLKEEGENRETGEGASGENRETGEGTSGENRETGEGASGENRGTGEGTSGENRETGTAVSGNSQESADKSLSGKPVFFTSDSSYFDDALFIGDSRTEGLKEYGGLGKAVVLCDSGMSIYRLWKENFYVDNKKQKLEQILTEKSFGKVYLMLGVNELGYDLNHTMKKYRETLDRIEETQPEAIIFIQANLHVTDEKSHNSDIYNNENINRINQKLEELAKERGYLYLDVNPIFDDENGCLSKEYTVDQAHILGIYYRDWANWLLEHCVEFR